MQMHLASLASLGPVGKTATKGHHYACAACARTHPTAKFTVKGQPSTDPAPWRRLHVVITCSDSKLLAKAEADVLDLCETACDVAADFLGLSDDQVQDAFEGIRVERQEVARLAQAWLDRGSRAEKDKSDKRRIKRNKAEIDPYLPPREPAQEDDPYSVMLAEAEAEDAAELPEPPFKLGCGMEAEAKAETVKSDSSEASDSEEEESEEEDHKAQVICRKHLQWAGDLATVWHLALSDLREKVAWTTLCTYFVSRKRVGLAELKGGVVYIVPPDDTFLSELGLPAAAETLAGSLLGLQVRTSELPTEESLQEEVGLNEKEVAKEATSGWGAVVRGIQSGRVINTMWADEGTVLCTVQMAMVRLFMIWPLKAQAPALPAITALMFMHFMEIRRFQCDLLTCNAVVSACSCCFSWKNAINVLNNLQRHFVEKDVITCEAAVMGLERAGCKSGVAAAVLNQLDADTQADLAACRDVLRRVFQATQDIQACGRLLEGSRSREIMTPHLSPKASMQDFQEALHPKRNESNVEQLLREWDSIKRVTSQNIAPAVLLSEKERMAMESAMDDAELLALKHAEISGHGRWALAAIGSYRPRQDFSKIDAPRRVAEVTLLGGAIVLAWQASGLFGSKVSKDATQSCQNASDLRHWKGGGRAAFLQEIDVCGQRCMGRLTCAAKCMAKRGYSPPCSECFGGLVSCTAAKCWMPCARGGDANPSCRRCTKAKGNLAEWMAWAFFHCTPAEVPAQRRQELEQLIDEGAQWAGVDFPRGYNPHVQAMRLTMDPIPSEQRPLIYYIARVFDLWKTAFKFVEASVQVMKGSKGNDKKYLAHHEFKLESNCAWDHTFAHFVGHSFGSIVVAWMCRNAKETVSVATFLDPVCFLLIKPDVCYNFMYREPQTATQLLMHYFVARELYIAHSLSRNFFWYQNLLWPEELQVPCMVMLSGEDSIVPAHSVRRFLTGWIQQRGGDAFRLLWFPSMGHGEMNFGPVGLAACKRIVAEMIVDFLPAEGVADVYADPELGLLMLEEPLSPTSALICHSLHSQCQPPPVAIVHEAHLNRRPSSKASSGEMGFGLMAGDMVLRPPSSSAPMNRHKADCLDGYSQEIQAEGMVEGGSLRLLSEEEVIQRASSALSYFRTTRQINRQARSVEEMAQS
eukprot:g6487.t1